MDYQELFKKDFIRTTIKIAKANWAKVSIVYFILHASIVLVLVLLSPGFLLTKSKTVAIIDPKSIIFSLNLGDIGNYFSSINVFKTLLTYTLIGFVIISWYANFSFIVIKLKLNDEKIGFGKLLIKSFNRGVLKILLLIFTYTIFVASTIIAGYYTIKISPWLIILLAFIFLFLLFKSIIAAPTFMLNKKSFIKPFIFSFTKITPYRMIKTFYFSLLLLTGLLIVLSLFFFVPQTGEIATWIAYVLLIIQAILQAIVFGFFSLLFITILVGLFYRFQTTIEPQEEDRVYDIIAFKQNEGIGEPYDINKNLFSF